MTASDLPDTGTAGPLTFDEGVGELARLLDTPATPEPVKAQDQEQPEDEDAPEQEAESTEEAGEVDTEQDDAEGPGPDEPAALVTAADEALVTLQDGTQITVGELKRNNLFQRDYSKKTQELKAERDEFEAQRQRVLEHAQRIAQQRDLFIELQQRFIPPMPDESSLRDDPIGYWEARNAHENAVRQFNELTQAKQWEMQQQAQQHQAEQARVIQSERERLLERHPELKDPARLNTVRSEMADVFKREYGLSPEEYAGFTDHRAVRVMLDALEYRKLKAAKPAVQAKVENKPPLLKSSKRAPVESREQGRYREANERLKKTGSREALVDVLKSFDL